MAFVIVVAIFAVVVFAAGSALLLIGRSDPRGKEQWRQRAPYLYLAAGLLMLICGWFSHAGAASWLSMAAGATLALSGILLILRRGSVPRR